METKICTKCGKKKKLEEFPPDRNACKKCKAKHGYRKELEKYKNDPEYKRKRQEQKKAYYSSSAASSCYQRRKEYYQEYGRQYYKKRREGILEKYRLLYRNDLKFRTKERERSKQRSLDGYCKTDKYREKHNKQRRLCYLKQEAERGTTYGRKKYLTKRSMCLEQMKHYYKERKVRLWNLNPRTKKEEILLLKMLLAKTMRETKKNDHEALSLLQKKFAQVATMLS